VRRALVLALAVIGVRVLVVVVAFGRSSDDDEGPRFEPRRVGNLTLPAQVDGPAIAATEDDFAPQFWPGVNLGSTIPGHQPGEVAVTREDYDRWLAGMGDLGVRVVRIYTILRPAFYDALAAYNAEHPERPIYFIQDVWIPEEELNETGNAYSRAVTEGLRGRDRGRRRRRPRRRLAAGAPGARRR
jgi:hypothetical protein